MKYVLCACSLIVCGISVAMALLQRDPVIMSAMVVSAKLSLFVGIYGLYANIRRDRRISFLEENSTKLIVNEEEEELVEVNVMDARHL